MPAVGSVTVLNGEGSVPAVDHRITLVLYLDDPLAELRAEAP